MDRRPARGVCAGRYDTLGGWYGLTICRRPRYGEALVNAAREIGRGSLMRVAVILRTDDEHLVELLTRSGFTVARSTPEELESAVTEGAAAVIADADQSGVLAAIARIRRNGGAWAALPVLVVGDAGERATAHVDAVQSGADAFFPRPVTGHELAARLRALLDTPPVGLSDSGLRVPVQTTGFDALSPTLAAVLRSAVLSVGGDESMIDLPDPGDESLDDIVPPELLEPLDAPLDAFGEENPSTSPGLPVSEVSGTPGFTARRLARAVPATPTLTPLTVGGDLRLSGVLGRFGVAELFAAAARSRATMTLVLRDGASEWQLAVSSGHLMALRGTRPEDNIGAMLARLGVIPREAARFAAVPLDAGPRGAALLAARGYIAPDALSLALARAAQESVFDLLCLREIEWEVRPLESAVGIPLPTRALDALLVLGSKARVEPEEAYSVLGGDGATVTLRSEPAALASLPLTAVERDAATSAKGTLVATVVRSHGSVVLPALAALYWLQHLRAEGPAHEPTQASQGLVGSERTRVRALTEAAARRDICALLGVSEWATRSAALAALDARRVEVDAFRVRYPVMESLTDLYTALDETAGILMETAGWERYTASLRTPRSDDR